MKRLFSKSRRWKQSDRLYKVFGDYELYDIGPMWVQLEDIIGLTLNPKSIRNDENMGALKQSVSEKGWQNTHDRTFHLVRLPNGKFTVGSGGNHRAYLAAEIGLESVVAFVSVFVPTHYLSQRDIADIKYFSAKYNKYNTIAKQKNKFLQSNGVFREEFAQEESEYIKLCQFADKMCKRRNDVFRRAARLNGLISKNDVALDHFE